MKGEQIFSFLKGLSKGEKRNLKLTYALQDKKAAYLKLLDLILKAHHFDPDQLSEKLQVSRSNLNKILEYLFQYTLRSLQYHHFDLANLDSIRSSARMLIGRNEKQLALGLIEKGGRIAWSQEDWKSVEEFLELGKLAYPGQQTIEWDRSVQRLQGTLDQIENLQEIRIRFRNTISVKNTQDRGLFIKGLESDISEIQNPLSQEAKAWTIKIHRLLATYKNDYVTAGRKADEYADHIYANLFLLHRFESDLVVELNTAAISRLKLNDVEAAAIRFTRLRSAPTQSTAATASKLERYCTTQLAYALDTGEKSIGKAAIQCLELDINSFKTELEPSRLRMLLYFAAKYSFYVGNYEEAMGYLDQIDLRKKYPERTDLVGHARILKILLKIKLDIWDIDYDLRSCRRYLLKYMNGIKVPFRMLKLLEDWNNSPGFRAKALFTEAQNDFEGLLKDEIQARGNRLLEYDKITKAFINRYPVIKVIRDEYLEKNQKQKGALNG